MTSDRIEKTVLLRAPRSRVWRALTNATEFGEWFGVKLTGAFAPGARLPGQVTSNGYEHIAFELMVERMEPERLLSWRWHPYPVDPKTDYSGEPTTLVVFKLEDTPDGTRLNVVESGFDKIPAARRAEAYRANEGGWEEQMANIARHVGTGT